MASQAWAVTSEAVEAKNREIYDDASGPVWHMAVYGPVHGGWEFINLGGARVIENVGALAELDATKTVIEFCSGLGAVCRYLAERYECRVTGVEWNPQQVANAREKLGAAIPSVRERVEIVQADCLKWQPRQRAHLVLSVDSMMLLPDVESALRNAYRCCDDAGRAVVVTIGAGTAIDDRTRKFAWDVDGMASLRTRDEYMRMMTDAGFEDVAVVDITELAVSTSERIEAAVHDNRDGIRALEGEAVYRGWVDVGKVYLDAFRNGQLAYLIATGLRRKA